jgi:FtsZ-binding cell division protein ZapB
VTATDFDPAALPDEELGNLLAELEQEEKQLSKRRDALHRRIDFVRAGGGGHDTASGELLESLSGEEKHVSKERQTLQRRIDLLRAEKLRRHASR